MNQPILALAFGTAVGFVVQLVAARLRYNGTWDEIPLGKKLAMSATGSIAAFVVGLWILDHPQPDRDTPFVYRLWAWQTIAAWAGSFVLDTLGRALTSWIKSGGAK